MELFQMIYFQVFLLLLMAQIIQSRQYLADYEDCGRRRERPGVIQSECFWKCEWVPNPFYRKIYKIEVGQGADVTNVTYYMLTRMIPRDLYCMLGCKLPDNKKTTRWRDFECEVEFGVSVDLQEEYNRCYLDLRKRFASGKDTKQESDDEYFYLARNPWDFIFDICFIASKEKIFKDSKGETLLCNDLVNCRGVRDMVKNAGLTLTNKTTASAEYCKEMCRKKRNLCDGWNWNRGTRNCELFSVVTKCSEKHANYKSGLCEAMYDIITFNGTSIREDQCYIQPSQNSSTVITKRKKEKKKAARWNTLNRKKNPGNIRRGRLFGASTKHINFDVSYPWTCSLRTFGFRGRHRCGATLLSAPPNKTVIVSAAHCNYICKDRRGKLVDICCCRETVEPLSCRSESSFCGFDPHLTLALPTDLQIVCGEHNIDDLPEAVSAEIEIVLDVLRFSNHYKYDQTKGPIHGFDVTVYHVNDTLLYDHIKPGVVYPACLPRPRSSAYEGKRAILSAWRDPKPKYFSEEEGKGYRLRNLLLRHVQLEETFCKDPLWMKSSTYYPPNVQCFRDSTESSCLFFGSSGSPVVRPLKTNSIIDSSFSNINLSEAQYAWIGPLSISKGCDRAAIISNDDGDQVKLGSENPGIYTDGSCYLDWIAEEYELKLDPRFRPEKDLCFHGSGDLNDVNKTGLGCLAYSWRSNRASNCNFSQTSKHKFPVARNRSITITFDRCKLFGVEGYAENLFLCIDNFGELAHCANNCLGVDPNAVVTAGSAVLAVSALGSLGLAQSFLGAGVGLGALTLGMMMAQSMCAGPFYCKSPAGKCCLVGFSINSLVCPDTC